jgi:hypothetical protein
MKAEERTLAETRKETRVIKGSCGDEKKKSEKR